MSTSDERLREQIELALEVNIDMRVDNGQPYIFTSEFVLDDVMKLIKAHSLQERIAELKLSKQFASDNMTFTGWEDDMYRRINSLTEELEKL